MKLVKQPRRLFVQMKKAVLREDLMKITGDITQAMVLGQMLYWTKTLDKVNDWLFEENKRLAEADLPQHEYNYGWIWKSAKEMREDLMFAFSEDAIQRAFSSLTQTGLLMKRNNPVLKYDRKLHYRIDLLFLRRKLKESGWEMTDFILDSTPQDAVSIPHGAESMTLCAETITEIKTKITNRELPLTPSKGEVESSAKASHSTAEDLNEPQLFPKCADARSGKSDDLNSRPPHSEEERVQRGSRKSPPKKREPKIADETFIAKLKEIYPDLDITAEMRKMDAWLLANPTRKKSQQFVSNWINRAAERVAKNNPPKQTCPDEKEDPEGFNAFWASVKPND